MPEVIGRMTCPVCGEERQDLKVNKNQKLYMYCDNGCCIRLNSKQSRYIRAQLAQKKAVSVAKLGYIRPITKFEERLLNDDDEDEF